MQTLRRCRKIWFVPGVLSLFLIHPLFSEVSSPESPLSSESLKQSPLKEGPPSADRKIKLLAPPPALKKEPLHPKEKKIYDILSAFHTGLEDKQEEKLAVLIHKESRRYGFEPELIAAVISTESSFYNWAISSKGAVGLMQIIPGTGRELAEINNIAWQGNNPLFDPYLNIKLGIHYLYTLYLKFGDIKLALTAYNYGPGAVLRMIRSGEKVPSGYVDKVLGFYHRFKRTKREEPVAKSEPKEDAGPESRSTAVKWNPDMVLRF